MNDKIHSERSTIGGEIKILVNQELMTVTQKMVDRFNARVDRSGGPHACWPWTSPLNVDGYGSLELRSKYIGAHRMAYQLKHGPISKGLSVLHNCPNGDLPACCNPAHLWLGTQKDNVLDAERKGRARHPSGDEHGFRKWPHAVSRGERVGTSKLKEREVREIRRLAATTNMTRKEIGEVFSITPESVGGIVLRHSWKHVI